MRMLVTVMGADVQPGGAFQADRRPEKERRSSSINHEMCVNVEKACHFSR